jgi:hypothetical protein
MASAIVATAYVRISGDHPEGWANATWDFSLDEEALSELDAFLVEFRERYGGRQRRALTQETEDTETRR